VINALQMLAAIADHPGQPAGAQFQGTSRREIFGCYGRLMMAGLVEGGLHATHITAYGQRTLHHAQIDADPDWKGPWVTRSTLRDWTYLP
jgi:hypothetical protein